MERENRRKDMFICDLTEVLESKTKVHRKMKFTQYLLTPVLMMGSVPMLPAFPKKGPMFPALYVTGEP